jgi:hypothetical protein
MALVFELHVGYLLATVDEHCDIQYPFVDDRIADRESSRIGALFLSTNHFELLYEL